MKKRILTGIFFCLIPLFVAGQEISFPELEGFKKTAKYPVYKPDNLWDFIDGAADTYLALGFVDLNVTEYKKGREVIKLEIYHHNSHTMAFGIYATERSPSYSFLNLGAQGYIADGSINFFKGSYYIKIRTYSGKPKILKSEESLARKVASMIPGEETMPALLSEFPSEGRKQNEETFINESVLGHQFLKKAFKAVYEIGSDNFSIYLIDYNTPQETFSSAETYLSSAKIEATQSDTGKYIFTDGYNDTVFLSWKENRMIIITGLAKDQADIADKYTSEMLK
jgi:hypothetical protein